MRADRLLALVLILQARGRVTAAALAAELEVSVRTVYRDIEALSAAGVPVFAEAGPGGGCQLLPGYRSPLDALSADEANALLILAVPAPLRELGLEGPLAAAQQRVRSAALGRAASTSPLVHLDLPAWFRTPEEVPALLPLARALQAQTRVTLRYRSASAGRARRRTLEPLGLVNKAGVWYLVARAGTSAPIALRVSRIDGVTAGEGFERPADFSLPQFWESWSAEFQSSRPRLAVSARVSPAGMSVLPEVFGDAIRPALAAAGAPDGEG